ncbi:MAG: hypothetical protein RBS89_04615 [Candidatus Delongbacteria bacterium]|nr:hypothetical protein [Candidatus Delongbacteria bacterium]
MKKLLFCIFLLFNIVLHPAMDPNMVKKFNLQESDQRSKYVPYTQNRVHRAGLLWMNISNCGWFGVWEELNDPCTGKPAPRGEMPGGSGQEYLFNSSIWFGGYLNSGTNLDGAIIFEGPRVSTAADGTSLYSNELKPYYFEDDIRGLTLGRIIETSSIEGRMNCLFEEVYDPKATAYEQFTTRYTDKGTDHFTWDWFDGSTHSPLGVEVKQVTYAWPYDYAKKFIIVDYTIYNRNTDKKELYDFFVGIYVDTDVFKRNEDGYGFWDDICGFIEKWDGYIDPATGEKKSVDMNLVWSADNDGRNYISIDSWYMDYEPGAQEPLDGSTGVFSIRVLRNPNPSLRYSFNLSSTDFNSESLDWGPRWKTGLHSDWQFDLTPAQKGYDDTNYDNLLWYVGEPLYGGRTEGTPLGEIGKYMVMSNDEFDYNLTSIREVHLGMETQADGTPIPQADKWQRWTTETDIGNEGFSGDIADGTIKNMNDIANGYEQRFILSFGPLGYETYENVAVDADHDSLGIPESFINKKVWKFAYGDSLKLTLAYMVSENFHTSLDQDPNYADSTVVDPLDGLDISLYDQGWYDAFYNVVWAERVFDTPMYDTPVTRWGATKKDGWFGEDVGKDAIFGDVMSDPFCWWLDAAYPGPDDGEGDFEMTTFTSPITDCYGDAASKEDLLLPFGRKEWSDDYGPTGNSADGEGYGYMVKYDKLAGIYPQGTWVRYGFDNGRLDAGDGVPDFTSPPPPPSPKITVTEIDNEVIVEWCSHEFYTGADGSVGVAGPEFTYDPYTRLYDFEGYSIELSPDRQLSNFSTIYSVDRVNYSYQNVANVNDYLDNPIPADTLAAHPEDYPATVVSNGKIYSLVPYGDNRNLTQEHELEGMFSYSCITATSPYPEWGDIRYYKFVLHNQTLAQKKYIAVTAKDFGAPKMGVPAIKSSPESNATATATANLTTTDDIIVVPNPYRGDVNYRDMGWEDNDGQYVYAEEYRKIAFLNIPERCVIRIYTLAGDLCKTIAHNGYSDSDTPYWYGKHGAYWNLINDNYQAVVSGIYLFSVQDVDKKKDDFVGKFVIIK